MSFSSDAKAELCRPEVEHRCCAAAEALGVLLFANTFAADGIRVVTESREFGERLLRLFRKAFGVTFDLLPELHAEGKRIYGLSDPAKIFRVFEACGFSVETSVSLRVNRGLLEKDCCRRAFLRGAFLAGGSVTDPEKRYHLELSTTHLKASRETETLMDEMGFAAKETERKGSRILYFKQSDVIEDFLTTIGAPVSAMGVMAAKIEKDYRNDANRKANCDYANLDKTVLAAQEQVQALKRLHRRMPLRKLPEKLRQTAILRLVHRSATLSELAELHNPPITKSAVNHRLRKLMALAEE